MTKAVIFDFFGVLSIHATRLFFEMHIPNYHERRAEFDELTKQHNLGFITPEEYLQRISDETGLPTEECMQRMRSERMLNEPLLEYIKNDLKTTYKIGMLSNAGNELLSYIEPKRVNELFDEVVISAEVGLIKPDPQIFTLVCERLAVTPRDAIMIDDSDDNCKGARAAGLQAVQYRTFAELKTELVSLLT
jgi:epoxide hydrolase-like predicted phosphatase